MYQGRKAKSSRGGSRQPRGSSRQKAASSDNDKLGNFPAATTGKAFDFFFLPPFLLYTSFPITHAAMTTVSGDSQLFEDHFTITNVDQSKYDRVARLSATTTDAQTIMTLDINTELFPCVVGEHLHCVLSTTLYLDGSRDDDKGWRDATKTGGENTLADMFDYVCHGKIYKFEDGEDGQSM